MVLPASVVVLNRSSQVLLFSQVCEDEIASLSVPYSRLSGIWFGGFEALNEAEDGLRI